MAAERSNSDVILSHPGREETSGVACKYRDGGRELSSSMVKKVREMVKRKKISFVTSVG